MTALRGNLNSVDLANIFQMLSMNQREGTLYIYGTSGRSAIYFGRDGVSMLARGRAHQDSLGRILLRLDWVTEDQVGEALRRQADGSGRMLGQVLVEQGICSREQVEEALRIQIEEEIYNLFLNDGAQFEFVEGPPADEFNDLEGVQRVTFNVNSMIMESAQRIDEWQWVQSVVPSTQAIFRYTGQNVPLEDAIFQEPSTGKVLSAIDGTRDVSEIVAGSYVNLFDVSKIIALLVEAGALELLPVPVLRGLADDAIAAGNTALVVKYLSQLVDLRGDTPEMHKQLAEALESERELERAAFHYRVYAEIQVDTGNVKGGFETYRRIAEILPTDLAASDRMIEVFSINPDGLEEHAREVIELGKALAEIYVALQRISRAVQVLHRVVSLGPDDPELRSRLIDVYLASGQTGEAIAEYDALAETAIAVGDFAQAEQIYRKMMSIDRSREDVQARLNSLISRRTRRRRGVRNTLVVCFFLALIGVGGWYGKQLWDDYRMNNELSHAAAHELLVGVRTEKSSVATSIQDSITALSSRFGDADGLVAELEKQRAERADIVQKAGDAVQAFLDVVEQYPGTPAAKDAQGESQRIEDALTRLRATETEAIRKLEARVQKLHAQGEQLVLQAAPTRQLLEAFERAVSISRFCTDWLHSEDGTECVAMATNLRESLDAFEQATADVQVLVDAGAAEKAFERAMDFYAQFPPADLGAEFRVPITIRSNPAGARIFVDEQDTGLFATATVLLGVRSASVVRLEKPGFAPTKIDINAVAETDPKALRRLVVREHVVELQKELAFTSPPLGGPLQAPPTVANGTAIQPTRAKAAERIDVSNGSQRERLPTNNPNGVITKPVVSGSVVALAAIDSLVYFYDLETLQQRGKFEAPGELRADPLLVHGLLVLADADGHVTAVSMESRREVWRFPPAGRPRVTHGFAAAPVRHGKELYATAVDGTVYVIASVEGSLIRQFKVTNDDPDVAIHANVTLDGDHLYAVSRGGRLYKVNRLTGRMVWTAPLGLDPVSEPLIADGAVFVVGRSGDITVLRSEDGQVTGGASVAEKVTAPPALIDGTLVIGDASGRLTAFDIGGRTPERLWQYRVPPVNKRPIAITTRPVVEGHLILFGSADNVLRGLVR